MSERGAARSPSEPRRRPEPSAIGEPAPPGGSPPWEGTVIEFPALPNKLFFRIGEVADLVGVKAHVLRYWEKEFGLLRPMKTRGSHRQYRRRDVETARLVRQLTEIDGYTVAGAKKKLLELRAHRERSALSRGLEAVRDDLRATLALIDVPSKRGSSFDLP